MELCCCCLHAFYGDMSLVILQSYTTIFEYIQTQILNHTLNQNAYNLTNVNQVTTKHFVGTVLIQGESKKCNSN